MARALCALAALVRAGHQGDRLGVRRAAHSVATDILRGARDRSRDKHLSPRLDQQARGEYMHTPRVRPRSAKLAALTKGKAPR